MWKCDNYDRCTGLRGIGVETWVKVLRIMLAVSAILFFLNGDVGLGIIFVILAVTTTGKVDWRKTKR